MVFGCLRRCGMSSSSEDLVPYEKASHEGARLKSLSPLSPPVHSLPPPAQSPHRKLTLGLDHNDSFVPLLCSTKMAGATGHHRSVSLLGGEGSFHDMLLVDRCRSLNHLDERPTDGRLLRHDHYSTEKFMSTSTVVIVDPSKIAGDRTRETKEESERVTTDMPLEPTVTITPGPLPMCLPSTEEKETQVISHLLHSLVSATVLNEKREQREIDDRCANEGVVEGLIKCLEEINRQERNEEWRETSLFNHTPPTLSPVMEEDKWTVYEDTEKEEKKSTPICTTPLSRFSSKRSNKLKIREDVSPMVDTPVCVKSGEGVSTVWDMKTPQGGGGDALMASLENAPLRPHCTSRSGVTINGDRVIFTRD